MHKTWMVFAAVVTVAGARGGAAPFPPDMKEVPLTLAGCVVAGEAKDSFLLTNVEIDGTTLAPPHAFYRFDSTRGLKNYVGRRVEVKGQADLTDVDKGKLRVRAHDDGTVTTEISSERRKVKIEDAWFGSVGSMKLDANVPTYKFDVKTITPLEGNCQGSAVAR